MKKITKKKDQFERSCDLKLNHSNKITRSNTVKNDVKHAI